MLSAFISFFPSLFWLTCSIVFLLEPRWWTLPVNHGVELVSSLQIHFPAFCCLQLAHQTWHSSEILSALELFRRDVYRMFTAVPGQSVSPPLRMWACHTCARAEWPRSTSSQLLIRTVTVSHAVGSSRRFLEKAQWLQVQQWPGQQRASVSAGPWPQSAHAPYVESRRMVLMNLFAGQQWRCRRREQTRGHGGLGGQGEAETNGDSSMEVYPLPYIK